MKWRFDLAIHRFLIFAMGRGDCRRTIAMNLATLLYGKTIRETFRVEPHGRKREAPAPRETRRAPPPPSRRLFRGTEPTTFHRCLAVHMHFAKHSGALD